MTNHFFALIFLTALLQQKANAQFYHKDIISIKQANDEMLLLQQQKLRRIIVHSFEADGSASEGFSCEKKISKDYRTVETVTGSSGTTPSTLTSIYNNKAQLIQSSDSSEITAASTLYEYDDKDNIKSITVYNHSSDDDFATSLKEVHQYTYNEKGLPTKMLRIKNDKDTLEVDFLIDANGNLTEEIEKMPYGKHYYYYYNDKNQMTDIVRYNIVSKDMKPDLVFEYNSKGQLTQMLAVEEGVNKGYYNEKDVVNYYTWRYFYNDEGLRIIEKCFSRSSKLLGYVEYEYE
jgi:hypothetical protein